MVELDDHDWEAQFAQLEQSDQQDLNALDEEANKAMEAELNEMDRSVEKDGVNFDDFESVWKGIQAETEYARQLANDERFVEGHMGDLDQWEGFDGLNTHPVRDPSMGDYLFEQENLFKNVTNPFEEGVKIMEEVEKTGRPMHEVAFEVFELIDEFLSFFLNQSFQHLHNFGDELVHIPGLQPMHQYERDPQDVKVESLQQDS